MWQTSFCALTAPPEPGLEPCSRASRNDMAAGNPRSTHSFCCKALCLACSEFCCAALRGLVRRTELCALQTQDLQALIVIESKRAKRCSLPRKRSDHQQGFCPTFRNILPKQARVSSLSRHGDRHAVRTAPPMHDCVSRLHLRGRDWARRSIAACCLRAAAHAFAAVAPQSDGTSALGQDYCTHLHGADAYDIHQLRAITKDGHQ